MENLNSDPESEEHSDEDDEPPEIRDEADNLDDMAREAINRLQEHIALLTLERKRTQQQNRDRAKEVFGMLMRAGFRRESSADAKFQPCRDDLEFLKGMDPALCRTLRDGSLEDFCRILHPVDSVLNQRIGRKQEPLDDETIRSSLERKDSLFHLHGNHLEDDVKEFKYLSHRAAVLARVIQANRDERVKVHLLDGHGRMLICLIKAVMDLGLDPCQVLQLQVFEIDREVHEYTVMVSLIIKDVQGKGCYCSSFRSTLGKHITGLGFLRLLRKKALFNAELVSVRPEDGIKWKRRHRADPRVKPISLKSGKLGQAFVTLLIRPNSNEQGKLKDQFKKWSVADLREDTMQIGANVRITGGKHKGKTGFITERTVAELTVEGVGSKIRIGRCEPYN